MENFYLPYVWEDGPQETPLFDALAPGAMATVR